MHSTASLSIPQPCHESWDAMSLTATGRHCAACATEVIDFTYRTDAEILAYLTKAHGAQICGRFTPGQLNRPLRQLNRSALASRWRAWLAATIALWGLRETQGAAVQAQASTEWRAQYWGGPVPTKPPVIAGNTPVVAPAQTTASVPDKPKAGGRQLVRGVVRDAVTNEPLPGVVVFVAGLSSNVSTDREGNFQLALSASQSHRSKPELAFQIPGYQSQQCGIPSDGNRMDVFLSADPKATGVEVVARGMERQQTRTLGGAISVVVYDQRRPWPWHPRHCYYWCKYWLTRPFHRKGK